mgnify:CR=1 FL=1
MIEVEAPLAGQLRFALRLRPNRSLSRRGLTVFSGWLIAAMLVTALISASQGNVLAPLFAAGESALVAWVMHLAWRRGDREERITLDRDSLVVASAPDAVPRHFHPYWVRVLLKPGRGGTQRLVLTSHGHEVEIGAFLVEDERSELARRLAALIAQVSDKADSGYGFAGAR